jgi:hypothetical protein
VPGARPALEIYLYDDEAGFFLGGEWRIWESADYSSLANLESEFLASLARALHD